jgi:hypothetical protein
MNAKQEFLDQISHSHSDVLCVLIRSGSSLRLENQSILTTGYTKEEYNQFLKDIDFDYDNGYGGQELFGKIWYTNGTWSSRGEYDGSEWWDYNRCPDIPTYLNRLDKVRDNKLNQIL